MTDPKPFKLLVLWDQYTNGCSDNNEPIDPDEGSNWDVKSFATQAELNAYAEGLRDANGWEGPNWFTDHEFLKTPDQDFVAWHNARIAAEDEELEIMVCAMAQDEITGHWMLASLFDPPCEPTQWDVEVRKHHEATGQIEVLWEREDLPTLEAAEAALAEAEALYPNAGTEWI